MSNNKYGRFGRSVRKLEYQTIGAVLAGIFDIWLLWKCVSGEEYFKTFEKLSVLALMVCGFYFVITG